MPKSLYSRHNEILLMLLKRNRQSMRLRQADVACRLGHGQATVSKVERGVRRLDVIELRAWLQALDVDFVAFIRELDEHLRSQPGPDLRLIALALDGRRPSNHRLPHGKRRCS